MAVSWSSVSQLTCKQEYQWGPSTFCLQERCCDLSMCQALHQHSSTCPHTLTTCCPQLTALKVLGSQAAQLNLDLCPPMTPEPGRNPNPKAMVKGTDRTLARFLVRIGMIGKDPRHPPNTLLGGRIIPDKPRVGMTTHSIALMT